MISGPIGVGKTAFALRLADDLSAAFPDGQLYADLSACGPESPSPDGIMRGFLRAMGVPARLVPDDRIQRIGLYRSLLAQRRLFVLLENAYDEGQVRPLLGQSPHSQFVVTSSARLLGLDGVHRIEPGYLSPPGIADPDRPARRRGTGPGGAPGRRCRRGAVRGSPARGQHHRQEDRRAAGAGRLRYAARLLADSDRLLDILSVGDVNVRDRFATAYRLLTAGLPAGDPAAGAGRRTRATAQRPRGGHGISIDPADELLESLVDAGLLTQANSAGRYCISTLVSVFAANTQRDVRHLVVSLPDMAVRDRVVTA